MKKIIYKLSITFMASIFAFSFSSCTSELDELWNNPNVHNPNPEEVVSGMFTHMQTRRFWVRDYGEWWWQFGNGGRTFSELIQLQGVHPLDAAHINRHAGANFGDISDNFLPSTTTDRFNQFFVELRSYGLIRDEVNQLSGEELADNLIYYRLARFMKNIVALQTVDLFNSIPFSNAFRGTQGVFFASYDDPAEIYKTVLADYKALAQELPGIFANMSAGARNLFIQQDFWFSGNIDRWVQYINAHMLRSSVRISGVEEAFARTHIAAAIQNLPQQDLFFNSDRPNEVRIGGWDRGGIITRAIAERWHNMTFSNIIMLRMNHGCITFCWDEDDPRLPVMAMGFVPRDVDVSSPETLLADGGVQFFGISGDQERNRAWRFFIPDPAGDGAVAEDEFNMDPRKKRNLNNFLNMSLDRLVRRNPWSFRNPITYALNEPPVHLFTLAEIDLLLAEVAMNGLADTGKTAGQHMYDAVVNSTAFWYMVNQRPHYVTAADFGDLARAVLTPPKPSAAIISNYASFIQNQFETATDQLEIIMQQKFIHLNIMDKYELFAEIRRTRRPKLEPISVIAPARTLVNQTMIIERMMYPATERTTNAAEHARVVDQDNFTTPIFWVPENRRNESYFMPQALDSPIAPPVAVAMTSAPTNVGQTTARLNGNILSIGNPGYTVRGFVFSSITPPYTTATGATAVVLEVGGASVTNVTVAGSGTGAFYTDITGLTPDTAYIVRAYATNAAGTAYGITIQFRTLP